MIDVSAGKMHSKIKLVFLFILFLSVGIVIGIYFLGERISQSTSKLVHRDVPVYQEFQRLRNQLSEEERHLYEYYASFDPFSYAVGFQSAQKKTDTILDALGNHFGDIPELIAIRENQQRVLKIAAAFDENMQLQSQNLTDWDLAREQLFEISLAMRSVAPFIEQLTSIVNEQVIDSQTRIDTQLLWVNVFVSIYGIVSLILASLVARAIKAYLDSNAINQRLSLFPKRTPNPIISLDTSNHVTYVNPATKRLLLQMNQPESDPKVLLTDELPTFQKRILRSGEKFNQFEYKVAHLTFLCELHWLADQNQWDLHLTDVSAQAAAEEKINFQAYHHPETCLANQYKFRDTLEESVHKGEAFSLGIVEIRSFNQLLSGNTFEEVQQAVTEIAAVLDKVCHDSQNNIELYHIGDKNFAVRIPLSHCESTVTALVSRIVTEIKLTDFSGKHQIELDFGFACFPSHGHTVEDMIHHARIALDASASEEHSTFKLFNDELGKQISRHHTLLQHMRMALSDERFQLYFQPQFSLVNEKLIGAEVLIRWQNDDEWISPAEFIPIAERSGLIVPLGDWILDTACSKARQFVSQGFEDIVIAVNISPKQFAHPTFLDRVAATLNKHNLPAKNLELEITEGVIFNNESDTIQSLQKLKSLGVKLAIDDFGTGYSSLSYLKQFPIDKLKIDQSFIKQMHIHSDDQSIVRTIIDLGVNLGLILIAEGVEERQHVEILRNIGCHEIQGYWYSKPLDEESFSYFLQSTSSPI